jgi:hypothetical protein
VERVREEDFNRNLSNYNDYVTELQMIVMTFGEERGTECFG